MPKHPIGLFVKKQIPNQKKDQRMAPNLKMQSATLTYLKAEEIPDQDFNTKMVKDDRKLNAPKQQIVPPKAPAGKIKVVQLQ